MRSDEGCGAVSGSTAKRAILYPSSMDLPLDAVAERSGLGSATTLRHHFTRQRGVSPQSYRRTFRRTA